QITDANWVSNNLLNSSAAGAENLKQISETLTLVPYGSATTGNTQIVRSAATPQIVNFNANLLKERALKVIWTVTYSGGMNAQSTTRQTVAIISKGGVAKW
ncbi:MAG TPA: hypothetical protein VF683_01540, partial [Chthoniobacterales bacterium]